MALPDSFSGVTTAQFHRTKPFAYNGSYYTIWLDSTDNSLLEMWKSIDAGTSAWSEQDGTNRPDTAATAYRGINAVQVGANIHIATINSADDVEYSVFDCSTDSWSGTIVNESVTSQTVSATNYSVAITVRSDGDVIIAYSSAEDTYHGGDYERLSYKIRVSGTWGSENSLDDGASTTNYTFVSSVLGASDKTHFVYYDGTNVQHKSLSSADSLSSAEACNDTTPTVITSLTPALSYHDHSGTERITVIWRKSSSQTVYGCEIDNDGTPGAEQSIGDNTVYATSPQPHEFDVVADDTNNIVYALYNRSSDQDLYLDSDSGSGWGTDTAAFASISSIGLTGISVYTNDASDTVLAVQYRETTAYYYDEYVLSSSGITISCSAVTLASAGQVSSITPGAVSVAGVAATLASAGQAASIVPGAVSISATAALLASAGQSATITPGAISITALAAVLASAGQSATINNVAAINATVGALSIVGQASAITPGAISVTTLAATLSSAGQSASLIVGTVTISATVGALSIAGQTVTLDTPVTISSTTGALSITGQAASITPGQVAIQALAAILASAGETASITSGAISIPATVGAIVASGEAATITPGAVTISASPTILASSGQSASITISTIIQAVVATLTASGQSTSIAPGAVSIPSSTAIVSSAGHAITLDTPVSILAGVGAMTVTGQAASLVLGAVIVQTTLGTLTINGQTVTVSALNALTIIDSDGLFTPATRSWLEILDYRSFTRTPVARDLLESLESSDWLYTPIQRTILDD